MKAVIAIFVTLSFFSQPLLAATVTTSNVKVVAVSVYTGTGQVLVETDPRPDISGLDCTSDYWLILSDDSNTSGYRATLSVLLTAEATQTNVDVRADNNGGNQFCKLGRVVLRQ